MSKAQHSAAATRVLYALLSFLLSLVLLAAGIAVLYRKVDWWSVTQVWTRLDPKLVALAIVLNWAQCPWNALRLERVIRWITERPSPEMPRFGFLFRLTCSAGFVAVAAPVGLAGDAAKIAALHVFGTLSLTDAARCALFDRVAGVQWLCVLGLVSLPLQAAAGVAPHILLPQSIVFSGMIAAIVVLLLLPPILRRIQNDLVIKIVRIFADYHRLLLPQRSFALLAIASINILLSWATLYLLLRAAGLTINPWLVATFIPLLQLVNGLPFLYMGWGGREIAMATTLGAVGTLSVNETLAVSIIWGAVAIASGALNGAFLVGHWRMESKVLPEPDSRALRTE